MLSPLRFCRCVLVITVAWGQVAGLESTKAGSNQNGGDRLEAIVPRTATLAELVQPSSIGDPLHEEDRIVDFRIDFRSDDADWFPQLRDFYQLDWTLPAMVSVDQQLLQEVGVRFKGASSYSLTPGTKKKSFDLDFNATFDKQRLYGYRKLNLNNGYIDPTMVREVLFQGICRHYVPAAKANLANLSINGTNWGVYASVQQINRDFLDEWFPNGKGNLWRGMIKPFRSARPFAWVGEDEKLYETYYELRSKRTDRAWADLVEVIRLLSKLPDEAFASKFDQVFAVDNALWLIALENVFMDNDSFLRKGYDYYIFQEPRYGRMHLIQHDGNEAFGSGARGQWPSGELTHLDPFFQVDNPKFPLVGRLLSIPELRQRYLAHVRTIIDEWLDWTVLQDRIEQLQSLAEKAMHESQAPLYPVSWFRDNVSTDWMPDENVLIPGLKPFVEKRRAFLLKHSEISQTPPAIEKVFVLNATAEGALYSDRTARIQAQISSRVPVDQVLVYYSTDPTAPFRAVAMTADRPDQGGNGNTAVFSATLPYLPAGSKLCFYVEAIAATPEATVAYSPPAAEHEFFVCSIVPALAKTRHVVINEIVTQNRNGLRDPQGDREDWIELVNLSNNPVDLSGYYLSDSETDPRKWRFPDGTHLSAEGRLLVFADSEGEAVDGLHAGFKLSKDGETLFLVDTDRNHNRILDGITIVPLAEDQAYGRLPDGRGDFQRLTPSPALPNQR